MTTDDDIAKKIAEARTSHSEAKPLTPPPAGATSNLDADLEEANKKIQELTETAKLAMADLKNFRKKTEEEKASFVAFANASLLVELLPVLDNFNRAFAQVPEEISKTEWFKGALQIEQQLVGIMRRQGVIEMESQIGKKVDPKIHEAITIGPGEKDVIIEEFEKGYLLGEKILRPAKVRVGNGSKA